MFSFLAPMFEFYDTCSFDENTRRRARISTNNYDPIYAPSLDNINFVNLKS